MFQGKCDFGSKCKYSHEDPTGELTALNLASAQQRAKEGIKGAKRKRESFEDRQIKAEAREMGIDFDPLGSSDEDDDDQETYDASVFHGFVLSTLLIILCCDNNLGSRKMNHLRPHLW